MDKHLHNIDQLFKDGIEGYTDPPSDNVWSNIDQQLDKREVSLTRYKYRIAKYAVAAMALLTVSFAMTLLIKSKRTSAPAVATDSAVVSNHKQPVIKEQNQPEQVGNSGSPSEIKVSEEKTNGQNNKEASVTTINSPGSLPAQKQEITKPSLKNTDVALSEQQNSISSKPTEQNAGKKIKTVTDKLLKEQRESTIAVKQTIIPKTNSAVVKGNNVTVLPQATTEFILAKTSQASTLTAKNWLSSSAVRIDESRMSNPFADVTITTMPLIKTKKFKPVFSIAAFYSPEYVTNKVSEGKVIQREDRRDAIVQGEKIKQSYNYGLQFAYQFSKHWAALTGIGISKTTSTILPRNLYARPVPDRPGQNPPPGGDMKYKINCTAGYAFVSTKSGTTPAYGDSIKALQSVNSLTYVSVPVGMKYIYKQNRFAFNAIAAIDINILTNGNVQAIVTENSGTKTQSTVAVQGLRPVNFSAMFGAGAEYFASNNLSVFVMPEASLGLNTINKNTPTQTKRGTLGMQAGLRFSF